MTIKQQVIENVTKNYSLFAGKDAEEAFKIYAEHCRHYVAFEYFREIYREINGLKRMKRFNTRRSGEYDEQKAVFDWVHLKAAQDSRYDMIYAVPNGGARFKAEASRLKAAGVKAGVADIAVDVPAGGYHGFKIEMKIPGNKLTPLQAVYLEAAASWGYKVAVCFSAEEAIKAITEYLNGGNS